ncbi:hypothetical protein M2351_006118 [Azospirillum canadense]|nr:hypothetical protein [Azospirillum canadense]
MSAHARAHLATTHKKSMIGGQIGETGSHSWVISFETGFVHRPKTGIGTRCG